MHDKCCILMRLPCDFLQDARQNLLKIGTPAQQKMGKSVSTGKLGFSPNME